MIYWGDETGIDNGSNCERGFAPKGQPPVLPVETKRERLNMLSALSRQGDLRFMLYEASMNQQRLIQFMDRLVRTSKRKVFLILDNLKVHHGKKAAVWLDKHRDKIELFFLPPYAPESNPDEYLNHALKLSVHSGDLPRTQCDIRHKTASFMRALQHSPDKVSSFFQHDQVFYILVRK
ncbi:MAG: IS630 family transposase [Acutalibacter muris]|nr:IS630 family transposase [Acutalibacter muris]